MSDWKGNPTETVPASEVRPGDVLLVARQEIGVESVATEGRTVTITLERPTSFTTKGRLRILRQDQTVIRLSR